MRPVRFALAAACLAAACGAAPDAEEAAVARAVTDIADRYVDALFDAFPEMATVAGIPNAAHHRLSDISAEGRARWEATEDATLAELESLNLDALRPGTSEAITAGFLREVLRNQQEFRTCRMELWNVSPTWTGWQQQMALLASSQPVATPELQEAALRRFAELPRFIGQDILNAREGLRLGYSAPRGNVEAVIRQSDALLAAPVHESPFVAMARDPESEFHARLVALETESIRPAIERYRDFLRDEYLPAAREEVGVSANTDGAACYRAAVRHYSTVDIPPEDVHRLGLEQMEAIRAEMAEIARRSFDTDDVDALLERLKTDPRYLVASRDEMLRIARDAVERGRAAAPEWFGILPRADVVVEPVPAFAEASAPFGYYNAPADDGSRPGVYYINLFEADKQPRAGLESTAFHEAFPGHHLQIAIAREREGLHPVSRYTYLSGFGEGWALYAERLADEMGLFTSDVDRMGLLSNEALRAARLVVDAGMHALGWSRQQAIDYMLANTAESRSSVVSEVDRYIAVPGQATAYMIGSLEFFRLRELARDRLGGAFDIREFHDRVLEDGAVPLVMLREKIERWLEASR